LPAVQKLVLGWYTTQISKITNFTRNFLGNDNDSEYVIKTQNAPNYLFETVILLNRAGFRVNILFFQKGTFFKNSDKIKMLVFGYKRMFFEIFDTPRVFLGAEHDV
jgi:hypothetical protein